ncbi:MAG: hypothetical protein WEA09_05280 [Gemmatimonadota bacterium]
MKGKEIRRILLEIVAERDGEPGTLQAGSVLQEAGRRLADGRLELGQQQALLTAWYDLFCTGLLSWGYNLQNPNPPFVHTTEVGRRTLAHLSRDPYNPDGYLGEIKADIAAYPVAESYLREGVAAFVNGLHRAAAVLCGAATEALVLALRDELVARISALGQTPGAKLKDWRVKTVRDELNVLLTTRKKDMDNRLWERFSAHFVPASDQIRIVRNDAGHPRSIEPISEPIVHANLLLFPEFLALVRELTTWVKSDY